MLRAIRLDVTGLLLWAGAIGLLLTLRSPYVSAGALAAGEQEALAMVRALATAGAAAAAAGAPGDPSARERLLTELHARCTELGLPHASFPELAAADPPDRILLRTPDWWFLLAATPTPPGDSPPDPPAHEAWAWPRRAEARLSTVFCVRAGQTLWTRNLTQRYLGESRAPEPGGARRRPGQTAPEYWGEDDQFWRPHGS